MSHSLAIQSRPNQTFSSYSLPSYFWQSSNQDSIMTWSGCCGVAEAGCHHTYMLTCQDVVIVLMHITPLHACYHMMATATPSNLPFRLICVACERLPFSALLLASETCMLVSLLECLLRNILGCASLDVYGSTAFYRVDMLQVSPI